MLGNGRTIVPGHTPSFTTCLHSLACLRQVSRKQQVEIKGWVVCHTGAGGSLVSGEPFWEGCPVPDALAFS